MINCCIEVKIAREQNKDEKEESIPVKQPDEVLSENDDTDDEDLFFDCDDKNEKAEDIPVWSKDPCGRLKRLGKQRLCHHDDYLYIPICQGNLLRGSE